MEGVSSEVSLTSSAWLVAHTRPRCEKKVVRYCEDLGVATTLPLYKSVKKYRGKAVTFEKPLFPGYVFLQATRELRGKILQSDYVANLRGTPTFVYYSYDPETGPEYLRAATSIRWRRLGTWIR